MSRLTASRFNLAERCTAWLDLPCVESTSEAAKTGSEVHKALQRMIDGEPIDWVLSTAAANMQPVRAYDWLNSTIAAHLCGNKWTGVDVSKVWTRSEVAYAAGPACNAQELQIKDRAYPELPEGTIVGTADVVVSLGSYGWVLDWKTTSSYTGISKSAGKASDNKQLAFLASTAAKVYGWDHVHVSLVHIGPNGDITEDWHLYEAEELELLSIDLETIASSPRKPRPGMHCHDMWCPAIASCPAHAGLMQPITGHAALPQRVGDIVDDRHAIWLYAQAKAAGKAAAQLQALAEDYVRFHGGEARHEKHRLRVVSGSRETIKGTNVGKLVEILDKYVPGAAAEIVTVSSSKTELERAIKAVAPRGKAASVTREALAELESAGYVSRSSFETIKYEESDK